MLGRAAVKRTRTLTLEGAKARGVRPLSAHCQQHGEHADAAYQVAGHAAGFAGAIRSMLGEQIVARAEHVLKLLEQTLPDLHARHGHGFLLALGG
jgi:hypothetical protein